MSGNVPSFIDNMFARFLQLSRAMRWATLAAIGLALFVVWDQAIRRWSDQWNKSADMIEARVTEVRANERVARDLQDRQQIVTAIGPVRVPTSVALGSKMFNDVVLEVLQKHNATGANFSSRSRGKLSKTSLIEITHGLSRVDRLTGDVKFEATAEAALAILADLESSPHIDAVNSVRITRDAGKKVKVALTIESWLLASDSKGETL